jgi:uncharacterized protein YlxW (UPF0749 family)
MTTSADPQPAGEPAADPGTERGTGRRRLLSAMLPRASRGQLLAAILCAMLGFAVVVQVQQTQASSITSLRQADLIGVLANLTATSDRLDAEARTLQTQRAALQSGSDHGAAAEQAARERLAVLGILAGTAPAHGQGLRLEINDPTGQVGAPGMLDLIEELRDAGAEALQIGPVRVVAQTAVTDKAGGGIQLDDPPVVLHSPFTVLAIGKKQDLATALKIPGGVIDAMSAKGATVAVVEQDGVTIEALHRLRQPQYARPAPAVSP